MKVPGTVLQVTPRIDGRAVWTSRECWEKGPNPILKEGELLVVASGGHRADSDLGVHLQLVIRRDGTVGWLEEWLLGMMNDA